MENIKLGIKDILKNKVFFVIINALVLIVSIIFISTSLSMSYSYNDYMSSTNSYFALVPISNDLSHNKELANDIYQEVKKDSALCFYSYDLSEKLGKHLVIIAGNGAQISSLLSNETKETEVYAVNSTVKADTITLDGKSYPLHNITEEELNLPEAFSYDQEDSYYVVYVKDETIDQWLIYQDGSELAAMIEGIYVPTFEMEKIASLLEDSYLQMVIYESNTNEMQFILLYVYPFMIIIFLSVLIAYSIFNSYLLKKKSREYSIHLLYGANTSDIILRNSVFILLSLLVDTAIITFLIQHESEPGVKYVYLFIVILLVIVEATIVYQIRNERLISNIREE